ncbi:MAG: TIGR02584 family CRISPR-associated protein [Nitrospirae bacterium]|nr:TIGR02584 family CRISPR-associated protein [Nitrospirota bacterium]
MKKTGYREIFIFIAGSTPQVITESIYALAMAKPPVYPHELYIITTCRGKAIAENALIEKGELKKLCDEYGIPSLSLKENSFIIPSGCSGNQLDDIRDESENEAMGDLITSFIREKTADPAARLHCSIAGGRKTMSFYLGAAMQLLGRPWDKLYHVLVTPEFESNRDFFYKPKKDKVITPLNPPLDKEGNKKLNTKNAEIILAELPFIRLRNKLSLEGTGFKELVHEGQRDIDIAMVQPELKVRLAEKALQIGDRTITLTPVHMMIYIAYLKHKLNRCRHPERPYCGECTDCFPTIVELSTRPALEEMAKDYHVMYPSRVEDVLHKYKDGLSQDIIRQAISKIKKSIGDALADEALTSIYAITSPRREYANTRHGVRVEKNKIKII